MTSTIKMLMQIKAFMRVPYICLLAVTVFAGCSKFEEGNREIRFTVTSEGTKGSAITTTSINASGQSFAINAYADAAYTDNKTNNHFLAGTYFEGLQAECDGSNWSTSEDKYWLNGVNLRFWSYAPISLTHGGKRIITSPGAGASKLSFTYELPAANGSSDATNQEDLIFAYNSETRNFNSAGSITGGIGTTTDQYINVHFYHALSQVMFAVSPDDNSFNISGFEIESITLSKICGSGSCEFNGEDNSFSWSSLGTRSDYVQTIKSGFTSCPTGWTEGSYKSGDTTYKLYNYNNSFFMIPQTFSAGTEQLIVTFKRLSDNKLIAKSVDLYDSADDQSKQWKAGYYYKYKIRAVTLADTITFGVTVEEWTAGTIEQDISTD